MKKLLLSSLIMGLMIFCSKNDEQIIEKETVVANKVLLLQVDYTSNTFEGGTELAFSPADSFTISSTYQAPGDFGSVQLYYEELQEKIFDGTIFWMGTGSMTYPTSIDSANTFITLPNNLPQPADSVFAPVMYDELAYYPDTIAYAQIWNAIDNLEKVSNYRSVNTESNIHLFLYTPSVGDGDPKEWDWFVILKN
jgi:hypothetical protein